MSKTNPHSKTLSRLILLLVILTGINSRAFAQDVRPSDESLAASVNEMLGKTYKADEPGASVIVVRDGRVILRKGYGRANMELGVPVEPDMVFRIGSITKQFTAVAILMLSEQGKLSLEDDITKFLPDYPTKGQKVTIEHLLTHTSGIKSYTSLPEWAAQWRKDISMSELIGIFKDKPMDFAPGDRWAYNNSAYVLLGAVIEKISGQTYGDFVENNIFAPLGMKNSFYDNTDRVIPRRVAGYSKGKDGFVNAAYLSMTQPHAAGSLVSTVDDLAIWDAALYTDKLVKQTSLARAWTSAKLNNAKATNYGYGWSISNYEGHPIIEHSGGINGFASYALRMPRDKVFVAMLTNRDFESPGKHVLKIAALAIGKPYIEPTAITLPADALEKYAGVYQLSDTEDAIVRSEAGKLFVSLPGRGTTEFTPMSETGFFIKDSRVRLSFTRNSAGVVTGFVMTSSSGTEQPATKTSKPIPPEQKTAAADPSLYDRYAGVYELAPGFSLTITGDGSKLMAQGTGQPKIELFQDSPTTFFAKEVEVRIEFVVGTDGKASSIVLSQGGQKLPGKRVN
ncbi:MAG: serine hydrolase [bacterium]|nr:serine hydrolase [bacterium]